MTISTLHQMLARSAERAPHHPVFTQRDRATSYEELEHASSAFALGLREAGIRKGDRVVLVLANTIEYLIAYYGILKAGAAVVPHYNDTRTGTLCYVLAHSEAHAVVLERRNSKLLAGQAARVPQLKTVISLGGPALLDDDEGFLLLEFSGVADCGGEMADAGAGADDLSAIVYTSGTTGKPKGVMLAHGNQLANIRSIVEYLELASSDVIAMVLPFFYVYGNSVLQTHVHVGGTIAQLGTMAFPAAVLAGIQKQRCTGISGVPSTFARLIQFRGLDQYDLTSLRYLTQAGGPMTPAMTTKLRGVLPHTRIFVMYGQTEASARLTYLPPADLDRKLGSAGIGIPGVTLRIMDKQGNELPCGEVGEIVAQGDNIMQGYLNNPEETARTLRPEGLRTGDLASMDDEGFIFITGRESDMIKSGAHRIGPKEIEDVVEMLPEVAQCAVVGVPDEILGEAIAAFIVCVEGQQITDKQVLRLCHQHLPRFKMPGHVRVVETLPRTQSGKLRRKELRGWFEDPGQKAP